MNLIEVKNRRDWRLFHRVLARIYRHDPNYIYPLEREVEQVFDPAHNPVFTQGEACCWVLLDERGQPAGRIAAFVDHQRNKERAIAEGGLGFFECIRDEKAAALLFSAAEAFLRARGVQVVDGPVNFGERDRFWGLLVHGFHPPLYQENYQPAYYQDFFRAGAYEPFEQILTFRGRSADIPFQRLAAIAGRLKERQPVRIQPVDYRDMETFSRDFSIVYNASFGGFPHFKPITPAQVAGIMEQARPIADPGLACIAYYEDQPAGFIVLYPDINRYLGHARGRLNWWTIPLFLLKKKLASNHIAKGMGFGVHPEFQSKGIFALLVDYLCSPRNLRRYPYMYLAGIRTHNHEIRSMYAKLNVSVDRVHVAFRKALAPGLEIKPFEFIEVQGD